jgi:hypothetical protein
MMMVEFVFNLYYKNNVNIEDNFSLEKKIQ